MSSNTGSVPDPKNELIICNFLNDSLLHQPAITYITGNHNQCSGSVNNHIFTCYRSPSFWVYNNSSSDVPAKCTPHLTHNHSYYKKAQLTQREARDSLGI